MRLRLIRHATLVLEYSGEKLLIDPMLDPAAARPAVQNSPNARKNPRVDLSMSIEQVLQGVTGVLVTHTHTLLDRATSCELRLKRAYFCT